MKNLIFAIIISIILTSCSSKESTSLYQIEARLLDGQIISLSQYEDYVILAVNIALNCGTTPQLNDLEKLYQKYKDQKFIVLGFLSDHFSHPDAGESNAEILYTCQSKYGVTFPVFEVCQITGKDKHEIFKHLVDKSEINFNFEKFLISREGKVIKRYGSFTSPLSRKITIEIEQEL